MHIGSYTIYQTNIKIQNPQLHGEHKKFKFQSSNALFKAKFATWANKTNKQCNVKREREKNPIHCLEITIETKQNTAAPQ